MSQLDEREAVEHVFQRLISRFPDVPAATVRETVHRVHDELDGPVRDYVPLLVENAARNALDSASGRAGTPAP
ncbi:hypothetical protein GALL_342600 [mine drainage metagenome]|uniref:Uncharacterized protein n=1 Tax=mine drainage metagenome TaxID=410659 RepID=A0A1J5QKD1_9ZZZZ